MSAAKSLVQTRIDPVVKERAAAILDSMGLTISDAVRILLTRTANEGELPFNVARTSAAHDEWFRSKVQEALADNRPAMSHGQVEAHFANRHREALQKAEAGKE